MSFTEEELRKALAPLAGDPEADARSVVAALPAWRGPSRARPWLPALLVGIAAGFLLALLLLGVFPSGGARPPGPFVLAAATGQVFVQRVGSSGVELLATGAAFGAGDRLRTDQDACASVRLPEGSEVRLNAATALLFETATGRRVLVGEGEIWTKVASGKEPFRVLTDAGSVEAEGTVLDIETAENFLSVVALEGAATLKAPRGDTRRVAKGQRAEVRAGAVSEPAPAGDLWQVTDWTVELLRFQGNHEEIQARVTQLLALIGRTKLDHLAEMEIRQLGSHCVLPMTRFIQGADADGERQRRRYAAGLVADLADIGHVRELFELLLDPDPEVRAAAFRGLARLTGSLKVEDEEFWKKASEQDRAITAEKWQKLVMRGEPDAKKK